MFLLIASGCGIGPVLAQVPVAVKARLREPIRPIPIDQNLDSRKAALGEQLFHEQKLSRDNSISCASCHNLSQGGVDRRVHSLGIGKTEGQINAPTVFNCGLNFKQFWDGRANSLDEQVDGPLQNPEEMGSTWDSVLIKLRASPQYAAAFGRIYPDGIQRKNIKDAIAQFERSLTTPNGRFDKYLRGDENALTAEEKEGYHKFKAYGCASCHQGVNIGGNMFEKFGAMTDYFSGRRALTKADYGRFNVTGKEEDRFVFKVPSLRNVALTPPYFHDGSAERLEDAVAIMGKSQLGRDLTKQDVDQIVKFLGTLSGNYAGKAL